MQSLSLMAKITLPFTIELRNVSHSASIEESQDNDNGPCAGAATDEPPTNRHPKAFFSSGMRVINSQSSSTAASNTPPANGNASEVTTITAAPDFHKAA